MSNPKIFVLIYVGFVDGSGWEGGYRRYGDPLVG